MAMNLEPSGRPVQQILDDALAGRRISAGDAHTLLLDGDLLELGMAAHEVRNRFNDPAVATYNVDRNINYTNICVYKCRFCAFYRQPGDPEGYLLPFEEIGRKVEETLALNGTGILMQGGRAPRPAALLLRGPAPLSAVELSGLPSARLLAAGDQVHRPQGADELLRRDRAPQGGGADVDPRRRRRDPLGRHPQGGAGLPEVHRRRSGSTSCARRTATGCAPRRP